MLLCVFKSILGYFILMFIGTNLIDLVVRGLVPAYQKDEKGNLQLVEGTNSRNGIVITIFSILGSGLYIFALYYYWNIGLAVSGLFLMISRMPDLLFELRNGEIITFKNMPKRPIDIVCTLFYWATLPLIWYSLC